MPLAFRAPYVLGGLLLMIVLLAACARRDVQGEPFAMNEHLVPPIDQEVPEQFETATFALG